MTRTPVASRTAFASAGATGLNGASLIGLAPNGPSGSWVPAACTSVRGRSASTGTWYSRSVRVVTRPAASSRTSSNRAAPSACATPPSTWPRSCTGLITVPASTACTDCRILISPVRTSTATRKPCTANDTDRERPSQYPSASRGLSVSGLAAIASSSARAARSVAVPATTVPVDPNAPVSCPDLSVSDATTSMSPGSQPSTLAAIWRCTVVVPLPNSLVPVNSSYRPSGRRTIRARPSWPPGGIVSSIATAMPVPARHPEPTGAAAPRPLASAFSTRSRHSPTPIVAVLTSAGSPLPLTSSSPGLIRFARRNCAG